MLRDGVLSAWAQSIYRRPSLGWVFATRQNLRSDMLYWTRIHTVFEHTRRKEREEEISPNRPFLKLSLRSLRLCGGILNSLWRELKDPKIIPDRA
jgi:hypothetical protein